ncbi:TRAP transporter substrate-binding protein [Martelella sp. HB161492]|uniref:TRAP transporter substrate-binding protein n=1 Tax=Martelella sp. HB161492 TaxID=2720726 RepID=UPI0015907E77|nr:TRAP transporter substrate-binding protein [Martelella sp. HB161492]
MKIAVRGALVAALLWASPSFAGTVLKVSSYLPPNHTFNVELDKWGKMLEEKSNGELKLQIYPAGQLGPVERQFDMARTGVADITVVLHSATPGRFPLSELAGLPLTYPSAGETSEVTSARLTELAPEYLADEHKGTKILWMAVTPPLKFNFAKVDPTGLDAFKGLRIRYAGQVFQNVIEKLGAVPMAVSPGETSDALSKGIIDAATFPFEATMAFGLAPTLKYSLENGIASATFAVVMNQAKFDSLSPDLQKLITDTTGTAMAQQFGADWDAHETAGRSYLQDNGVSIVALPDAEAGKLKDLLTPMIDEGIKAVADTGKPAQAFYDAYVK